MLDFIQNNYFLPFYAIAFALSLWRYKWYYDSILKYFPIIIGYTFLSEVLGFIIFNFESFQIVYSEKYPYANNFIFNIFEMVFFLYFYYVYYKCVNKIPYQKLIKYGAMGYFIASFINPFYQDIFIFPQVYASSVGSMVLILAIVLFLLENRKVPAKVNNLLFWVSAGLLIFNLFFPIIMLTGLYNYELYQDLNLRHFHYIMIVVMYTCFIIGFIKMHRMKPLEEEI